ncbi:ABC transporter permease [Saccharicrinis fermentans]|uniref:Lipoprotein-releasing system transmembrane protein LolC n=1 Tax=Saccharicrinis fermentans DSM 9555 = JCM 21142 TaxID=869213 RepID=W7YAJ1_9BACT|nr:FtsX-like permease family protein [Saccharicrinis fermentans]GAF05377.1 lipoprotein-releasing system transmembrane protein LolC [Saccharicrinis fermentans DSM 9555 = JCM 21142]
MKLVFQIALKFLFGKKSKGIINLISTISIVGVGVGSLALLAVLSVFNGLHGLIGSFYGSFDPDLKIEAVEGKFFSVDSLDIQQIANMDDVRQVSPAVEDNALLKYNERRVTGIVLGVDSSYRLVSQVDSIMVDGKFNMRDKQGYGGVIGYELAHQLAIRPTFMTPLVIYVPQRNKKINLMRPDDAFNSHYVHPKGIFMVKQKEYDAQYLMIDIELARKLFQFNDSEVSYLAVALEEGASIDQVQGKIKDILGSGFTVKSIHQQHASFYKMMGVEKLMSFLILCFILIIATFNLIGTMSMLIFDKREGIRTLKSIGADKSMVTRVFLLEGWLISLIGVAAGVTLGVILILAQQHLGIIKFAGGGNFVVDAYPVKLIFSDIILSFITVTFIGFMATLYPVKVIVAKYFDEVN